MFHAGLIALLVVSAWVVVAVYAGWRMSLSPQQALLYAPLKVLRRIDDRGFEPATKAGPPLIYAVSHQTRLDPALMLSLLPSNTLHILDEMSARSVWMEPWRELARTIAFNATHVFVSRRLVRQLRGNGRIAVYFPVSIERDTREFRLYRAVARIAQRAGAGVVAIAVTTKRTGREDTQPHPRAPLSALRITALPPLTIEQLVERASEGGRNAAAALHDRIVEARRRPAGAGA